MKHTFSTVSKGTPNKTTATKYTPVPAKDATTKAPSTAAKGDDEVMSTPAKKS